MNRRFAFINILQKYWVSVGPIVYITLKVNHALKSTIVKTMCMSHDTSKHITKVLAKPSKRTHHRACTRWTNTIFKIHIYKLKVIPTYGKCGILIPSANKRQYSAFIEELEAKSLDDGHQLIQLSLCIGSIFMWKGRFPL